MSRILLVVAAIGEALTGLALIVAHTLVARLLLGEELTGNAGTVARVAGLALIGLALACWPGPPRVGMLVYSVTVALYLAYLGVTGTPGVLLWPAVVLHALLSTGLAASPLAKRF